MSDVEWFGPAYGRQLNSDWPEDQLAVLEVEWAATPERVARAREVFQEAKFDDFEPKDSLGRRWLHRESGVEYILDESQVLDAPDPSSGGVEFYIVHGGRIWFLRRRDHDPVEKRVIHGHVVAREVKNDFQPPPRGLRKVIALRLHADGGQRGRDNARGREVDRLLAKLGIRSSVSRTGAATLHTLSGSLEHTAPRPRSTTQAVRRTAPAKTPPATYSDPHFAEAQREAWDERRSIVRRFGTEIRVR